MAKYISHPSAVVHTYSSHTMDKLLSLKVAGPADPATGQVQQVLRFGDVNALAPTVKGMLAPIIETLASQRGISQNEYLIKCVVRIFIYLRDA